MGVSNLTSEARGFLYTLFNEGSKAFRFGQFDAAENAIACKLSWAFGTAAGAARMGKAPDVEQSITDLKADIDAITTPGLKDAADTLKLTQQLMYKHTSPQLKADLGSYSGGVF